MGVLIETGELINKNTSEGGAYLKGAVIGKRVLNQIITVIQHASHEVLHLQ